MPNIYPTEISQRVKYHSKWLMNNHNLTVFQFCKKNKVVVPYDTTTRMSIIAAYKDATKLDG